MRNTIIAALGLLALGLAGCDEGTAYKRVAEEPQTTVAFNGTVEGCRLYHVHPAHGSYGFDLAICGDGRSTQTQSMQNCGKSCKHPVRAFASSE